MDYEVFSFRNAEIVLAGEKFKKEYAEIIDAIQAVDEAAIIDAFKKQDRKAKSISEVVNKLLKDQFVKRSWRAESAIFQDADYEKDSVWRLDFAKGKISIEVAFNHGEAVAWNLLKPVLASEYNHVKKAVQTEIGVIICATKEMKDAGGFDSAVADFDKYKSYLVPLQSYLTAPLLLIGLKKPKSFSIQHKKTDGKVLGSILLK